MRTGTISCLKLSLLVGLVLLLTQALAPGRAYAQWPPFDFKLNPRYENNRITYRLTLSSQVEWRMTDLTIKVPLPEGTRFVEANTFPSTQAGFDGKEVTFSTATLSRSLKGASFVVEVTDPARTVFTTHAWVSWKGDYPGDYLTKDQSLDITRRPLDWQKPRLHLQLEASALVAGNLVTYAIYPTNVGGRMWDLRINVPVPEGTTFLSTEIPQSFTASFDGREVSFFTAELAAQADVGPLIFRVSTERTAAPLIATHAWAAWKNVGRNTTPSGQAVTADIVIHPHVSQWVVSDMVGDAPFPNSDIASIAFQEDGKDLKVIFYTAGDVGALGQPLEFTLFIDSDCRLASGSELGSQGVEYRLIYRHSQGKATLYVWDAGGKGWLKSRPIKSVVSGNAVSMWLPHDLFPANRRFCWVGHAANRTQEFTPNPPPDTVLNSRDLSLTLNAALGTNTTTGPGAIKTSSANPNDESTTTGKPGAK